MASSSSGPPWRTALRAADLALETALSLVRDGDVDAGALRAACDGLGEKLERIEAAARNRADAQRGPGGGGAAATANRRAAPDAR